MSSDLTSASGAPPEPASEPSAEAPRGRPAGGAVGIGPGRWGVGQVLLGALTAVFAVFIAIAVVSAIDPDLDSDASMLAAQAAFALALIGVALAFAAGDPDRSAGPLAKLGLRRAGWGAIGLAFAAWVAYIIFASQISPLLQPDQEDVTRELGGDAGTWITIAGGILIIVAAPLSEEIFFRGFMFAGLRRHLPLWTAAAISALVWGLLHLSGGNLGVALQLAIFGLLLAWLYDQTGSLWPPIIAHAVNNGLAFTLLVTDAV
jgi:membrane protease YdiL (CAAX protease family)